MLNSIIISLFTIIKFELISIFLFTKKQQEDALKRSHFREEKLGTDS